MILGDSKKFQIIFSWLILTLVILSVSSAKTETLCSYAGPDVSEDLLRLTDFSITGPSPLREGDTIVVKFNLQNYGQSDLKLGSKGIFVAARDPDNLDTSFGFTRANTTLKVGETVSVEVSRVLDKAGTWKIWPSYHLSLAIGEKLGPDNWHACSLQVVEVVKDSDQDGISDEQDNCPQNYNPKQEDIDGDGIGDTCDSCDDRDSDQDGIKNCLDKCPDKPENYNQYQDDDGCPDEIPKVPEEDKTPPTVEISATPTEPHTDDRITFTAQAKDSSGIKSITIFVNNVAKKQCVSKCKTEDITFGRCFELQERIGKLGKEYLCSFTGGPYPAGTLTYKAEAFDNKNNKGNSEEKTKNVTVLFKTPPETLTITYRTISGKIFDFPFNAEKIKMGVCPAEKRCDLGPEVGKKGGRCYFACLSEATIVDPITDIVGQVTETGYHETIEYQISLRAGKYIIFPVYQPIGDCGWEVWQPGKAEVDITLEDKNEVNFTYQRLGGRTPKVDLLILTTFYKRGSRTLRVYPDGERERLEDKIREYQLTLAKQGVCSYFGYLDSRELTGFAGSDLPGWYTRSDIRGIIRQLVERLNSSYLLIFGEPRQQFPLGWSYEDELRGLKWPTDDFYGDLDGDYLLDIPVGRIPVAVNVDLDLLINYFDTVTQLHKNGGVDLSNYQALYMDGNWTTSFCLNKELFGKMCNLDSNCKNNYLDCTLSEANSKGFFLFELHGSDDPLQKFSTNNPSEGGIGKCLGWETGKGFIASDLTSLNVRNSLWMAHPCYSSFIENKDETYQSIPMTFLKNGGAVYIGNTDVSYGSYGCPYNTLNCKYCLDPHCGSCSEEIPGGDSCSGTLYLEIAKRFLPHVRIGDAFLEGKNYYYRNYDCTWEGKDYIYHITHLYGDPTLKIKNKW